MRIEKECCYKEMPLAKLNHQFIQACKQGWVEEVQYLLESPELTVHAYIHTSNGDAFTLACANGHVEVAIYLLSCKQWSYNISPIGVVKNCLNEALLQACTNGQLHIVKTIFQKAPATIIETNRAFKQACISGKTEIVQYLLAQQQCPQNINHFLNTGFELACLHMHKELVEYFIFSCSLQLAPSLNKMLNSPRYIKIKKMIDARDLHHKLQHSLCHQDDRTWLHKI